MKAERLITSGLVWHATQHECVASTSQNPENILSQGYCHEVFSPSITKNQSCCPTSVLLPFIGDLHRLQNKSSHKRFVVFLGSEVWPTPFSLRDLLGKHLSLTNFLFINPSSQKNRERALETLARSSNVLAVITYLQRVSFAFTQKLYLLSKESHAYTFVFRDLRELNQKSAAHSRWEVTPVVSKTDFPSWNITLRHVKGSCQGEKSWLMEGINEEEVFVHLLSELVSGSGSEEFPHARSA